ncbi:zf-HC2 domain-containing protein [Streptomyces sp. NPDC052301]|uniref:zf-HC2 domain-containing protein n=1 Tax=Streptomyces sp. NPDC052301 TaxID=3365687 RepID=UPI0037D55C06
MSGSRPKPVEEPHLAEQHLGDRLSALVDGELGHETRERVLAHLATCARCKAEAEAQRALKNVFAEAAPPPPSASLLARLQGLPGGGDMDGGGLFGHDPEAGVSGTSGVFGVRRGERFAFGYVPAGPRHTPVHEERGFRIHPVGRPDEGRSASRGLRFAAAAAGAVSLAAVALGGVTTAIPGDVTADARSGSGTGNNIVPTRSAGTGAGSGAGTSAATPETQRRRPVGPLLAQGGIQLGQSAAAPTFMSAPMVPGLPSPDAGPAPIDAVRSLTAPVLTGAAAVSPLIRPLDHMVAFPLADWSTASGVTGSGLLPAPVPHSSSAPSVSPSASHGMP